MAKITFVNKVENEGLTDDGKVFAVDMNEIKTVVNTNEDLRTAQTAISGVYSSTFQSLQFRNSVNTTIFSISLADLVTGGGGISDAPADNSYYARRNNVWESFTPGISDVPADNSYYARRNNVWESFTPGISDAPLNTNIYGRSGGGWVILTPGISDAPADGSTYARKDGNWVSVGSGGTISIHNELSNRDVSNCHPISAITNLQTTLTGKASLAGDINQDFTAKILTIGTSIILNGRTLTIRTL